MPQFSVQYIKGRGFRSGTTTSFQGTERGWASVTANDRVGAYALVLTFFSEVEPDRRVCLASRQGGSPLGFSAEEMRRIVEKRLPFASDLACGDIVQIEAIELEGVGAG